jgi:CRP-like cAMP-binding protein
MRSGTRKARDDDEHAPGTGRPAPTKEWSSRAGLFHDLDPRNIDAIAALAQRRRVARHAFFFQQGDPASGLHVLLYGRAKLVQTTAEGHQVVVRIVGPGDMFAGAALFGDAVYPASAEAMSASEALVWPTATVERLFLQHPKLAINALRVVARRRRSTWS